MTARRIASLLLFAVAAALLVVAALTPLRAGEIAELDAEAERIGRLWTEDQGNAALARESNEFYDAARDLEPPLGLLPALGSALLFGSAGIALWPARDRVGTTEASAERASAT